MVKLRTSNPVFKTIERSQAYAGEGTATYQGIVAKTAFLLLTAVISGYLAITYVGLADLVPILITALIVAFIAVIIAVRSVRFASAFGIVYALSIGIVLGVMTTFINSLVPGVALAAVIATATIFTVMLFLYSSRIIRVTTKFKKIMFGIFGAIILFVIISLIMSLFTNITFSTPVSLGISGLMIVFGAIMLAFDFDRAESIVESGADKRYEWMIAVGLMVTLVWIYIELLRFMALIALSRS